MFAGYSTHSVAVGATRDMVTGNYKWDTGASIPSEDFYPGEPKRNQNCIQMLPKDKNFQYDDIRCEILKKYVCEKLPLL